MTDEAFLQIGIGSSTDRRPQTPLLPGARLPEVPPPARLLARAIFRREWRVASLITAVALAVAGAALGRVLADRGLLPEPTAATAIAIQSIASLGDFGLWLLARALPLPIALLAGVATVDRLAGDSDAPWLFTLVAAGIQRGFYVAAVVAAVTISHLALYLALTAGYLAGAATLSDEVGALALHFLRNLPGVAALLLSTTLYGAACLAIARRRGLALALALVGLAGPIAVLAWIGADGMQSASPTVVRLATALTPPPVWTSSASAFGRHALYSTVLLSLLTKSASRWVARNG